MLFFYFFFFVLRFLLALECAYAHLVPFSHFVLFCCRYLCDFSFASVRTLNGTNTNSTETIWMRTKKDQTTNSSWKWNTLLKWRIVLYQEWSAHRIERNIQAKIVTAKAFSHTNSRKTKEWRKIHTSKLKAKPINISRSDQPMWVPSQEFAK